MDEDLKATLLRRRSSIASLLGRPIRRSSRSFVGFIVSINVIMWLATIYFLVYRQGQNTLAQKVGNWMPPQNSAFCSNQIGLHLPLGKHYLVDMFDVDSQALAFLESDPAQDHVANFIKKAGMTLLGARAHRFPCGGITAVWLLSESHVSIHTWPENGFIALDVYTCGASDPSKIVDSFAKLLQPKRTVKTFVNRGSTHEITTNSEHVLHVELIPNPEKANQSNVKQPATKKNPLTLGEARDYTIVKGKNGQGHRIADICIDADDLNDDCIMLRNVTILEDLKSQWQRVEVVDTQHWGRCMLLDRVVQYCESDNQIYTDELIDRAMKKFDVGARTAGSIWKKLNIQLIGGGDGWVPSALLERYGHLVNKITAVDIDPLVSKITQKHFSPVGLVDAFKDPRVSWIYDDAGKWVEYKGTSESMEIVIVDCTDHTAEAAHILYTEKFYKQLFRMLKPGGVIVQQMNTDAKSYKPFFIEAERVWTAAGFQNLQKWKQYIPSFLGESVFWMAEKYPKR